MVVLPKAMNIMAMHWKTIFHWLLRSDWRKCFCRNTKWESNRWCTLGIQTFSLWSRQHDEKTRRQSNRKGTPINRFNYGVVTCSICGGSFFCEAMATKYYDGIIACLFDCATKSQEPNFSYIPTSYLSHHNLRRSFFLQKP